MTVGKEFSDDYEVMLYHFKDARKALIEGNNWEFVPESAEYADAFPYYCDDCDTFHRTYYCFGYEVDQEDGEWKLFRVVWSCDDDGNWEKEDSAEVGSVEEANQSEVYSYEKSQECWKLYYDWVLETGREPLNEMMANFFVPHAWWGFFGEVRSDGLYLLYARPTDAGGGMWLNPKQLPDHARKFLLEEGSEDRICGLSLLAGVCKSSGSEVRMMFGNTLYGEESIPTPPTPDQQAERARNWARDQIYRKSKEVKFD